MRLRATNPTNPAPTQSGLARNAARALLMAVLLLGLRAVYGPEVRAEEAAAELGKWEVVAREDGVVVEEQRARGRTLPIFRGTIEITASPALLVQIIQDVEFHTRWMPNCAESRVIGELDGEFLVYRRTAAPWPVADRDVVLESRLEVIRPDAEIDVLFESIDESNVPAAPGAIRMPHVSGSYKLRALPSGRTRVEYLVDADPGGSLPSWLASATSKDNPLLTLIGLREEVERRTGGRTSG